MLLLYQKKRKGGGGEEGIRVGCLELCPVERGEGRDRLGGLPWPVRSRGLKSETLLFFCTQIGEEGDGGVLEGKLNFSYIWWENSVSPFRVMGRILGRI